MKVYKVLRNTNEDMHVLQQDLYSLEQWSTEWQLKNVKRCESQKGMINQFLNTNYVAAYLKQYLRSKILAFIFVATD